MESITRTVFSSYLQTCLLLNLPFVTAEHTTLNEKFNIQNGILPDPTDYPHMRYYAIGNGGHQFTVGTNGVGIPEPVQHKATDAALYNHLPFVLREVENDLSVGQRAQYGLRRIELINGKNYVAYYLRRLDFSNTLAGMEYISVQGGVTTVTNFVPTSSNLNPVPQPLSNTGVNVVSGDYVSATAKVNIIFTKEDITEFLNVVTIIYGDDNYAVISEIALVSGVDKTVAGQAVGNATVNYNEVIVAQVMSHINTLITPKFSNNGTTALLDVGSSEPLFSLG